VAESGWRRLARWLAPGGRQAIEGVLVVTDQQILFLRDDAELVGGALAWGYVIRATTHERLAAVHIEDDAGDRLRLRLDLAATDASETLTWTFAVEAAGEVRRVATLLDQFLPCSGDVRLRRLGRIPPRERLVTPPAPRHPGRTRSGGGDDLVPLNT
jgi:hypothetical protein